MLDFLNTPSDLACNFLWDVLVSYSKKGMPG